MLRGLTPGGVKVGVEGSPEEVRPCQSGVTETSNAWEVQGSLHALLHPSECAHTHSFSAHYDAGDVDERWE